MAMQGLNSTLALRRYQHILTCLAVTKFDTDFSRNRKWFDFFRSSAENNELGTIVSAQFRALFEIPKKYLF